MEKRATIKKNYKQIKLSIMPALEQLGMQTAGNVINGLTGAIFGKINDNRQLVQQGRLTKQQMQAQKELTDYNMKKQLEMWEATGYGAQVKQMEEAGLNPALIYGKGGGGGITANVETGNVTGGSAPSGGGEIMGLASQTPMMIAQAKLLDAQAENLNADTNLKEEQAEGHNQTNRVNWFMMITDGDGNDTQGKHNVVINEDGSTMDINSMAIQKAMKEIEEKNKLHLANQLTLDTWENQVNGIIAEAAGKAIQNSLNESKIKLTDEQAKAVAENLAQGWAKLSIEEREVKVKEELAKYNTEVLGAKTLQAVLGSFSNVIFGAGGAKLRSAIKKGKSVKTREGYNANGEHYYEQTTHE